MRTVYKYELAVEDLQEIGMPVHSKMLCVQVQNEIPCLWALVDTRLPTRQYLIATCGTGHPIDFVDGNYIGTYQLKNGVLVFHVFELS